MASGVLPVVGPFVPLSSHAFFLRWRTALVSLLALSLVGGCGSRDVAREDMRETSAESRQPATDIAPRPQRPRIVALGDSLTAGLGVSAAQSYPAQLQRRVDEAGYDFEVVNMGVSGDTSAGGLSRLDWALEGDVRVLIVALGANDGLRGLSPADLERNLGTIVDTARDRKIAVLLCGMEVPPNLGASYTSEFREVYRRLAREKPVVFLPFLLDGVAGVPALNQSDGIHPNPEGARRVADLVWRRLQPMLDAVATR